MTQKINKILIEVTYGDIKELEAILNDVAITATVRMEFEGKNYRFHKNPIDLTGREENINGQACIVYPSMLNFVKDER